MKYVIVGAGSRGMIYGNLAKAKGIDIAAIAEKRPERLKSAAQALDVPRKGQFRDAADLFAQGKLGDAAIIATQDRDHFGHVMAALDCGYDILLEKPIAPTPQECIAIEEKANALGRKITVCHVLRYTNFFTAIKDILDSGEVGKIVSIKHSENIGNFHMPTPSSGATGAIPTLPAPSFWRRAAMIWIFSCGSPGPTVPRWQPSAL